MDGNTSRMITIIVGASLRIWIPSPGFIYLQTIWYQSYKVEAPVVAALHFLPAAVVGMIACVVTIFIAPLCRVPVLLVPAGIVTGICAMLLAVEPEGTSFWKCEFVAMIYHPWATDMLTGIGSIIISNLCDDDEQSVMGALYQTKVQISYAFGICIASLVVEDRRGSGDTPGDLLKGLRAALWMDAGFARGPVRCDPHLAQEGGAGEGRQADGSDIESARVP